ncbi:hypothetical protein HDU76_013095 [Blyttiomyces sp. JEL0837]|nr:hypothetical protein HDU76_013095 [Blyttiomyces sp. JEL0837]
MFGPIPEWINLLVNLQYLALTENFVKGPIPSQIGELRNLKTLSLWGNQLSGPIPSSLGDLVNLEQLTLKENNLEGALPYELGKLINLKILDATNNNLTHAIPESFGGLVNLEHLSLAENGIEGPLPLSLGELRNLKTLLLNKNRITGPIPQTMGNMESLELLTLADNQLEGSIPETFGKLKNLKTMNLSENELSGEIPESLGGLVKLEQLTLHDNAFRNIIPAEIISWVNKMGSALTFSCDMPSLSPPSVTSPSTRGRQTTNQLSLEFHFPPPPPPPPSNYSLPMPGHNPPTSTSNALTEPGAIPATSTSNALPRPGVINSQRRDRSRSPSGGSSQSGNPSVKPTSSQNSDGPQQENTQKESKSSDIPTQIAQILLLIERTLKQPGQFESPLIALVGVLRYIGLNYNTMNYYKHAAALLGDTCIDIAFVLTSLGNSPDYVARDVQKLTILLYEIQEYYERTFDMDKPRRAGLKGTLLNMTRKTKAFFNAKAIEEALKKYRERLVEMVTVLQLGVTVWSHNLVTAMTESVSDSISRAEKIEEMVTTVVENFEQGRVKNRDKEAEENRVISLVLKHQEEIAPLREQINLGNTGMGIDMDQARIDQMQDSIRTKAIKVVGKSVMEKVQSWMIPHEACTWDVEQELGRGYFSTVYVGTFREVEVAVKVFNVGKDVSWQDIVDNRIAKEVNAWQTVSGICPYVVTLLGFSVMKEKYIVMELCDNNDARRYLRRIKSKNPDKWVLTLIRVLYETALGLQAMKENKILHRDIKGPNILIRDDGTVAIGDFGLGRDINKTLTRHTHGGDTSGAKLMSWGDGETMEKPVHCDEVHEYHEDLWKMVTMCVQKSPNNRLDIDGIVEMFDVLNERVKVFKESKDLTST